MRIPFSVLVALATTAGVVAACSTGPATSAPATTSQAPVRLGDAQFVSTTNVDVASDGRTLWAVVLGVRRDRRHGIEVFRRGSDGRWERQPAPGDGALPSGQPVGLALGEGAPCLSLARDDRPDVRCLRGRRWRSVDRQGLLTGGALVDLESPGGVVTALLSTRTGLRMRVLRDGRWRAAGPPIRTGARGQIGHDHDAGRPLTAVMEATASGAPSRTARSLKDGRWAPIAAARGGTSGPMVSGAIRRRGVVYLGYSEARNAHWPFTVLRDVGRSSRRLRLNEGPGAAQGTISATRHGVWAMWQENELVEGRGFRTAIRIRRVDGGHGAIALWQGMTNGPGDLEVVDGPGGPWAAYMPARSPQDVRRTAVVEPLMSNARGSSPAAG